MTPASPASSTSPTSVASPAPGDLVGRHRRPYRLVVLPLALVGLVAAAAACGSGAEGTLDTLPPIRTTSTTTTTTTTPDMRRIFYVVQSGDNLSDIAKSYQVTVQSIRELNRLTTDVLQVGQELEIPNDIRIDLSLPTTTGDSTDDESSDSA